MEADDLESDDFVSIPSSSGHQFTAFRSWFATRAGICVSIPSSSGHQFTEAPGGAFRGLFYAVSIPSSSGHQFTEWWKSGSDVDEFESFNPFFIRASVYCMRFIRQEYYGSIYSFNPFFIRASVYWPWKESSRCPRWRAVSIPSSSGHQFTGSVVRCQRP